VFFPLENQPNPALPCGQMWNASIRSPSIRKHPSKDRSEPILPPLEKNQNKMKPKNRLKNCFPIPNYAVPDMARTFGTGIALCVGLSILSGKALAGDAVWNVTANAFTRDWNANANWTPNTTYPNGIGEIATMDTRNITGGVTANVVNLNIPIIVGQLLLGDTNNTAHYSIRPGTGGSLTFDNTGSTNAVLRTSC
jgi:hypothetical protein